MLPWSHLCPPDTIPDRTPAWQPEDGAVYRVPGARAILLEPLRAHRSHRGAKTDACSKQRQQARSWKSVELDLPASRTRSSTLSSFKGSSSSHLPPPSLSSGSQRPHVGAHLLLLLAQVDQPSGHQVPSQFSPPSPVQRAPWPPQPLPPRQPLKQPPSWDP